MKINKIGTIKKLLEHFGMDYNNCSYYAWPQTFSSTTGPNKGIGGQTMTEFTVEVYTTYYETLYVCTNCFVYKKGSFEPNRHIKNWKPIPNNVIILEEKHE